MRVVRWTAFALIALLAAGSIALAACGGDDEEGGATPAGEGTAEATPTGEPTGEATATATGEAEVETPGPDAVTVKLTTAEGDEWGITSDTDPLAAGQYIFEITNPADSEFEHEVEVLRGAPGSDQEELAEVEHIAPGQTETLVVTLDEPGPHEFVCKITEEDDEGNEIDHYEMGMHSEFEVVE